MNAGRLLVLTVAWVCVGIVTTANAESWREAVSPTYPGITFNDVFFVDTNNGWIVGSKGLVLRTTNGGGTWTSSVADSLSTLYAIHFLDANNGFVSASSRRVFKTTNGGADWTAIEVTANPDADSQLRAIYFADAQRGWVMGTRSSTNGRVLHTTDGGVTWTLDLTVAANNLIDMSFAEANKGVVTGKSVATLYYTKDGTTWNLAPTPSLGGFTYTRSDVRGVFMVDSLVAYATGWGSSAAGLQPSIHLKTTDGGENWTYMTQAEGNRTYDNLYGIWFRDATHGIAVGGAIRGSVASRTTDGGANWIQVSFPCGATLNAVWGYGDNLWVVGGDGVIFHSTDFGNTWQLKTDIPSATVYAIQFTSSSIGYAAGFDGLFLKTTNNGSTWKGSFVVAGMCSPNINDIHFLNDNVGYTAHSYRMVSKTTDGGATWSAILSDTTTSLVGSNGVHFVDENNGYAVGQFGSSVSSVYKTTDGGQSWTHTSGTVAKALRDVAFVSSTVGAAVGDGLKGIYTTDGGATWSASTITGTPSSTSNLRGIVFLNATTALASGDKVLLKSTDAGANWQYVTTPANVLLYSITKYNATTAYAVGSGEVWKTTDAGDTWTNIIDAGVVTGTQYSVGVNSLGFVWTGSTSSTMYTTSPLVKVSESPMKASAFSLKQNYPNPFNPSTTISFTLAQSANVVLKVYNLIGQEIATVIDGEVLAAGEHQYAFDALNLPSGVYFYRVTIGGIGQTRKMVLMR